MRSRYDLMEQSFQKDENGKNYPDVLTLDLTQLTFSSTLNRVVINQRYKSRPYLIVWDQWNSTELDDLLMLMNGVSIEDTLEVGETLLVPTYSDMNMFYARRRVSREET